MQSSFLKMESAIDLFVRNIATFCLSHFMFHSSFFPCQNLSLVKGGQAYCTFVLDKSCILVAIILVLLSYRQFLLHLYKIYKSLLDAKIC